MPVIAHVPKGGLPQEGIAPLMAAMKHYVAHIQAAEAKGAMPKQTQKYRQAAKEAYAHLTAGQAAPPAENVIPAAMPHGHRGHGGGHAGTSVAQEKNLQQQYQQQNPSQQGMVANVANPPRPVTAA